MKPIALVTDSTAILPAHMAEEYGIHFVPLRVFFGEEGYLDGVEMTPETFYQKLATSPVLPRTSQPLPVEFADKFAEVGQGASGILCVTISSKLSGTYDSARLGAREYAESENAVPVRVVDSLSAGSPLTILVIKAARALRAGSSLDETNRLLEEEWKPRARIIGFPETLEYLEKGGRIGKASALLGTVLKIKPLVHFEEGALAPAGKVRTKGKAIEALIDRVLTEADYSEPVSVFHAAAPGEADKIAARLKEKLPDTELLVTEFSPVLGTHVGPGTLGAGYLRRAEEGNG